MLDLHQAVVGSPLGQLLGGEGGGVLGGEHLLLKGGIEEVGGGIHAPQPLLGAVDLLQGQLKIILAAGVLHRVGHLLVQLSLLLGGHGDVPLGALIADHLVEGGQVPGVVDEVLGDGAAAGVHLPVNGSGIAKHIIAHILGGIAQPVEVLLGVDGRAVHGHDRGVPGDAQQHLGDVDAVQVKVAELGGGRALGRGGAGRRGRGNAGAGVGGGLGAAGQGANQKGAGERRAQDSLGSFHFYPPYDGETFIIIAR